MSCQYQEIEMQHKSIGFTFEPGRIEFHLFRKHLWFVWQDDWPATSHTKLHAIPSTVCSKHQRFKWPLKISFDGIPNNSNLMPSLTTWAQSCSAMVLPLWSMSSPKGVQKDSQLSGTLVRKQHQHTLEPPGTLRNLPPEPTPAHTGTLQHFPEVTPEPSGNCFPNLHHHTPEPSGTFRNLHQHTPELSGTCLWNPTPAHTGTFGTFLRNLPPEPAPATRTGTHRSLSGLKTPLAYAVGEKQKQTHPAPCHILCNFWCHDFSSLMFRIVFFHCPLVFLCSSSVPFSHFCLGFLAALPTPRKKKQHIHTNINNQFRADKHKQIHIQTNVAQHDIAIWRYTPSFTQQWHCHHQNKTSSTSSKSNIIRRHIHQSNHIFNHVYHCWNHNACYHQQHQHHHFSRCANGFKPGHWSRKDRKLQTTSTPHNHGHNIHSHLHHGIIMPHPINHITQR